MEAIFGKIEQLMLDFGPKVIMAVATLVIGWMLINLFSSTLSRMMEKKKIDETLRPFLKSIFSITFKVLLIISVAAMVGVETTSFLAVVGAAGLAVGLALQGSLANLAGGVLILILRPFKVGDYITGGGHSGTVDHIQIFYTYLRSPQNQIIMIPNGDLANDSVVNYSAENERRMDLVFGISYSDDIDKARAVLLDVLQGDERVDQEPEPQVLVDSLGDSSVNLKLRFWTNITDFWTLYFEVPEQVKKKFDENGITIPFPQRDIHQK